MNYQVRDAHRPLRSIWTRTSMISTFVCEATGQSPGARRASFFLSHECQKVHMSVRVILGKGGHAATNECAGATLFFSTPKENLLHFSISSVGRLDPSTLPLGVPHQSMQVPSRPDRPEKEFPGTFHWLLRAIPKKKAEERLTCRLTRLLGSEHQHVEVDQSPRRSCHHWSPPRIPLPPRSTGHHQFPLPQ